MVYCTKCGTENEDDAEECSNCGYPLKENKRDYSYRRSDWEMDEYVRWKGRYSFSLLFGIFLILVGASSLLDDIFWWASFDMLWPVFIIAVGIVIVSNSIKR